MTQKVIQIGTSAGITLPKKSLKELGLAVGDEVRVTVDTESKIVSITPVQAVSQEDTEVAKLTLNFIKRYRSDLEDLKDR